MVFIFFVQAFALFVLGDPGSPRHSHQVLYRPSAHDTVRVVLFDSLLQRPLEGATVMVSPGGAMGVTDSLGQLTVASERPRRLVVYHDVFERIGMGGLQVDREPADSGTVWSVSRAVPSMSTLWRRLCDSEPVPGRLLVGFVRLANGTAARGARVTVQWQRDSRDMNTDVVRSGNGSRGRKTSTDSASVRFVSRIATADVQGLYAVCGVVTGQTVALTANLDGFASGNVLLVDDAYPVSRQDLVVATQTGALRSGQLNGTVTDTDGLPLGGVTVWVDGVAREQTTNALGAFALSGVPLGTRAVGIRKIGYLPVALSVDVLEKSTPPVNLVTRRASTLEEVRVSASWRSREREEFDLRRGTGQSQYIDSTELAHHGQLQSALHQLRGTEIRTNQRGDWLLMGRFKIVDRCTVYVYLNGSRLSMGPAGDAELLRLISPAELAAVEYFSSDAHAPARFRPLGDSCGILLLWTKGALR